MSLVSNFGTKYLNSKTEKYLFISILFIFALILGLISIGNVYQFKNAALDEGMFNHALYNFSKFHWNKFTLDIAGAEVDFFGDHFSPIILILSPLRYVFGIYTLTIVQNFFILIGAIGVFVYAKQKINHNYLPILILFYFTGIWAIYSAISFGFHSNVIAAMALPWLILAYEKDQKKTFLLLFAFMLLCKENVSIWLFFVVLGLSFKKYIMDKNQFVLKKFLSFEFLLLVFCLVYFVGIVSFLMPYINGGHGTNQLARYRYFGNSVGEIILFFVKHPIDTLTLFFKNNIPEAVYDGIKMELHFMVLVSGGLALLFRPHYFIMLLPIFAQKLLTDNPPMWGVNYHYCIEFVPILAFAVVELIAILPSKFKTITVVLFVATTHYYGFSSIESRKSVWYDKSFLNFYNPDHYSTPYNSAKVHEALKKIPDDAIVSASSSLAPNLSARDKIYHFPVIKNANYIALFKSHANSFPFTPNQLKNMVDFYFANDPNLQVVHNSDGVFIAKIINGFKFNTEYINKLGAQQNMNSVNETYEEIEMKIRKDKIWSKQIEDRAKASNVDFEIELKNNINFICESNRKKMSAYMGIDTKAETNSANTGANKVVEDYNSIKAKILSDPTWKGQVEQRAKENKKPFDDQLNDEILFIQKK